jgi:hypothetical protein
LVERIIHQVDSELPLSDRWYPIPKPNWYACRREQHGVHLAHVRRRVLFPAGEVFELLSSPYQM